MITKFKLFENWDYKSYVKHYLKNTNINIDDINRGDILLVDYDIYAVIIYMNYWRDDGDLNFYRHDPNKDSYTSSRFPTHLKKKQLIEWLKTGRIQHLTLEELYEVDPDMVKKLCDELEEYYNSMGVLEYNWFVRLPELKAHLDSKKYNL